MLCVIVFVVQIHCTWQVDILGNGMLLVNINALPEVFKKVAEAKGLIASGKARTASEASKMCGISRSAYYKYKDSVFEYSNPFGRIVTLYAVLRDKEGVLSAFLSVLYSCGCNILTVNQGLPLSGKASVSVSIRIPDGSFDVAGMIGALSATGGVISVRQTA